MNTNELREWILEAQGSTCAMPGCEEPWTQLAHIRAASLGGSRTPSNLLGLCAVDHQNFDQHRRVVWEAMATYIKHDIMLHLEDK